ncbi:unnamed protein product [Prunus armeniaca]
MKRDEACTRTGMCWQCQMIQGSFLVCQKKPSGWFFNLRHSLQFGIGLHHAGLNDKDRSLVEELFANNKIQAFLFYLSIGLYQYIGMGCKPSRSILQQLFFRTNLRYSRESQVSVGAAFGVGQSTVSQVTWRFIEALEERAKHHLKWPDSNRTEEIKSKLEEAFGLPNCCGAINGTHIIMTLPTVQTSDDWRDLEDNYSMLLLS